jgi:hypothetical protein
MFGLLDFRFGGATLIDILRRAERAIVGRPGIVA